MTMALEGSSTIFKECPLTMQPIMTVSHPFVGSSGHAEVVEDSKDGIISDVR